MLLQLLRAIEKLFIFSANNSVNNIALNSLSQVFIVGFVGKVNSGSGANFGINKTHLYNT